MINKKFCLAVLAFSVFLAASGICSASQATTPNTITVSSDDWTMLQENNSKQQTALKKSAEALAKAKSTLAESTKDLQTTKQELLQSQSELQTLRQALTASQKETAELLASLKTQRLETQMLKQQLTTLQEQSLTASTSITAAQKYLDDTREELLANEKARKKTERSLKNKITAWQVVSVILGGVALAK